jgi:16S rRNA (guanine966-N2)-methyltransferase
MKDRVRESLFNRLGTAVRGKLAIDLFAGTGALGIEALSRGAAQAIIIERHVPTAQAIRRSLATLEVVAAEVVVSDTFHWARQWLAEQGGRSGSRDEASACGPKIATAPWLVFCSPPYDFYVERLDAMLDMVRGLVRAAPAESIFVVECDSRFDLGQLPEPDAWDVRTYPPAVVAILRRGIRD